MEYYHRRMKRSSVARENLMRMRERGADGPEIQKLGFRSPLGWFDSGENQLYSYASYASLVLEMIPLLLCTYLKYSIYLLALLCLIPGVLSSSASLNLLSIGTAFQC